MKNTWTNEDRRCAKYGNQSTLLIFVTHEQGIILFSHATQGDQNKVYYLIRK